MKNIKIEKTIKLDELKKVIINNEMMGTYLIQSDDDEIHITADLTLRSSDNIEGMISEDFILVKTSEAKGTVNIDIDEIVVDEEELDISVRSILTVAIPAQVIIKAETDNYSIVAGKMNNDFEISNENGPIKMEECSGEFSINNENGPVKLINLTGNLSIEQENGPISADHVAGDKLDITSENGSVKMRASKFEDVTITNENGIVYYDTLILDKGSIYIQNENGHIHLSLAPTQGFTLEATSELGQIKNSFVGQDNTMFDNYNLEVGDKAVAIKVTTENGMIKISSSDMLGGDFFLGKMDYIKEMLKENSEQGIHETHKMIGQLIGSLSKLLEKVTEDAAKEKIEQALAQLKAWKGKINDPEFKESVKDSFEGISQEVGVAVQEALKTAQEAMMAAKEKYHEDYKPHFEKHFAKGKDFVKHFRHFRMPEIPPIPPIPSFGHHGSHQSDAMQEKARMKILEMLEAGKITSDEAEKLLKAIH